MIKTTGAHHVEEGSFKPNGLMITLDAFLILNVVFCALLPYNGLIYFYFAFSVAFLHMNLNIAF